MIWLKKFKWIQLFIRELRMYCFFPRDNGQGKHNRGKWKHTITQMPYLCIWLWCLKPFFSKYTPDPSPQHYPNPIMIIFLFSKQLTFLHIAVKEGKFNWYAQAKWYSDAACLSLTKKYGYIWIWNELIVHFLFSSL